MFLLYYEKTQTPLKEKGLRLRDLFRETCICGVSKNTAFGRSLKTLVSQKSCEAEGTAWQEGLYRQEETVD